MQYTIADILHPRLAPEISSYNMVKHTYAVGWGTGTVMVTYETDPVVRMQEYVEAQKSVLEKIARDKSAGINHSAHLPDYNGSDAPDD
jgi:hypothetical protein